MKYTEQTKFTFEENGFTSTVTDKTVKWEIPIKNLINAFNLSPDNYSVDGKNYITINEQMKIEFAKYVAKGLIQRSNRETGASHIEDAIDEVFMGVFEGDEGFAIYPD